MMRVSSKIAGVALGLATLVAEAQPAAATVFTFNTTSKTDSQVSSATFKSNIVDNTQISMRVTAWHANDIAGTTNRDTISTASLGLFTPGIGVISAGESYTGNEHQIDNVNGGVDFVMLQFSSAVSLTGITRNVYALTNVSPMDSDAAYWADTAGLVGTAANWNSAIDLTKYNVYESLWSTIPGTSASGPVSVTTSKTAAVWLVGADFLNTRDDGFKLAGLTVSTPVAAVPEPASWAMMTIGFGALGGALRRRRAATSVGARFA